MRFCSTGTGELADEFHEFERLRGLERDCACAVRFFIPLTDDTF